MSDVEERPIKRKRTSPSIKQESIVLAINDKTEGVVEAESKPLHLAAY